MTPANHKKPPQKADPISSGERRRLAELYRQKADEARHSAERATDPTLRAGFIDLANGWTYLALHTESAGGNGH